MPSHLRRRSRGCENAYCYATKENEFFPIHNPYSFLKSKNQLDSKVATLEKMKGNAVVTIPMRRQREIAPI
jgi:hypothetical protein